MTGINFPLRGILKAEKKEAVNFGKGHFPSGCGSAFAGERRV